MGEISVKWAEIGIRTSHEAMELVAEIFHDLGASGVVIEDPELLNHYIDSGLWDYTDLQKSEQTEIVTVKAYLPMDEKLDEKLREFEKRTEALSEGGIASGPCDISWNEVQDEDWSESWKQYFHTEKIGGMIVIKPSWEEYEASPDDIVIEMDPGAAFGTGTHPTTSMCIRELESMIKGGMEVTDVGTGSGVLAIAAVKLGASHVTAVDYDETALKVARENIRRNHVEGQITAAVSDLLHAVDTRADVVVANIVADIIIRLFDELGDHMKEDGRLLCSGIIADRIADVTESAIAHGFFVEKVVEMKGWAAMVICQGDGDAQTFY